MQSQLLSLGGVVDAGVLQRLKESEQPPGNYQASQARVIQLEGQVRFDYRTDKEANSCFPLCTCAASTSCVCACPGEDPAAGARPKPDVAGERPAAAQTGHGAHGERSQVVRPHTHSVVQLLPTYLTYII